MPETKPLKVEDLSLDLKNYRMTPKRSEVLAVIAMISVSPDRFWALMHSLLDDGYHPTENILVLKTLVRGQGCLLVKEGNRRIAALKLALGQIKSNRIDLPDEIEAKITTLSPRWKSLNSEVPCTIYDQGDAATVDKIVTMTHGKSQNAGRDIWKAVARARHNRDQNGASEPGLDMLEKYLTKTSELSPIEADRWGGVYPITVLDEALKILAPRCELASAKDLSRQYPDLGKFRHPMDRVIKAIGFELLSFGHLRDTDNDFAASYGFPSKPSSNGKDPDPADNPGDKPNPRRRRRTNALSDVRTVRKKLRMLAPTGSDSEKIVTLINELLALNIVATPHAFCFVLRSVFEISAKIYCDGNGIATKDQKGKELYLRDILQKVTDHITNGSTDKEKLRELHGALTELKSPNSFLSVTSMNQLVHSRSFAVTDTHICTVFSNIFPLLEEMNK